MRKIQSICVYCGSSTGSDKIYLESARLIGKMLAKAHIQLIYGGGTKGIMGSISHAVKDNGGKVVGIIPRFLIDAEAQNNSAKHVDELIITETMHERKQLMFEKSDAFLALPGGIGTLEEIIEIMTWAQLNRHSKPIAFANINGFWNPIVSLLDHMKIEGFIHTEQKLKPLIINDINKILETVLMSAE